MSGKHVLEIREDIVCKNVFYYSFLASGKKRIIGPVGFNPLRFLNAFAEDGGIKIRWDGMPYKTWKKRVKELMPGACFRFRTWRRMYDAGRLPSEAIAQVQGDAGRVPSAGVQ